MNELAAAVAADQLRAANHAIVRGSITATEAYEVVGSLDDLAGRLPQVLDFLVRSLRRDGGDYFHARDRSPEQAIDRAHSHLDDARHHAADLAADLTTAHNQLGRHTPED